MKKEELKKLEQIRKDFHRKPEISTLEFNTQKRIIEILKKNSPDQLIKIAKTGVLAVFKGIEHGKSILIRCDIDALPIEEANDFEHKSIQPGVSHKCGHDGHTVIVLGLAKWLSERPMNYGEVILLFQPAEENGEGAKMVINDPAFSKFRPDLTFALHNLPGYPLHQIVYKNGNFTASVKSMVIKLYGKTAHAAEPEHGINPGLALAELIQKVNLLLKNNPQSNDFRLATLVKVDLGELAYGVSAGYGEMHYTLRTWDEENMLKLCNGIEGLVERITEKPNLRYTIEYLEEFFSNNNSEEAVEYVKSAAKANGLQLYEKEVPVKWGEDFGLFTEKFKGAMFGIGAGTNCPALHNPDYDFPDEIIETGIKMFTKIISLVLHDQDD